MNNSHHIELRVLHTISYAENGGAQVVINNLISEGDKHGIESHLVFVNTKEVAPSCVADVENINFISGNIVKNVLSLVQLIRRHKIDVLHSHTNPERRLMSVTSILTRVPHVYHVHTRMEVEGAFKPRRHILKRIANKLFRRFGISTIIATSELVESDLVSHATTGSVTRIEPGINFVKFKDLSKVDSRNLFGIHVDSKRILVGCPSRLEDKKGVENLIEAVANISEVDLVILGTGSKKQDYEKLSAKVGVFDRTTFIDHFENMPAFYSACDVIVTPSFEESFSLVFLEAIASTRPVVASDIEPFDFAREYVHSFKVGDSRDLERELIELITKIDNDLVQTLDLEELKNKYSMQQAASKVHAQYRRVAI